MLTKRRRRRETKPGQREQIERMAFKEDDGKKDTERERERKRGGSTQVERQALV